MARFLTPRSFSKDLGLIVAEALIFEVLSRSFTYLLTACCICRTCSVVLSLLNKAILSSWGAFDAYLTLLFCQLLLTLGLCVASRDLFGNPFHIPPFSVDLIIAAAPMGLTYALNAGLGLLGLQLVDIHMYFALRRVTSAFVLAYEYFALGRVAPVPVRASVGAIVVGAVIAGWDSLRHDAFGYAVTLVTNAVTAASSVTVRRPRRLLVLSGESRRAASSASSASLPFLHPGSASSSLPPVAAKAVR